ncbi:unnamed protein product [Meloidogyne enterolobii]|uniref:Uncharacterized protein n=1 Tax=Meloidogyne enterolobii TaxID=390850 RepID=A0ACB1AEJ3_MELEN
MKQSICFIFLILICFLFDLNYCRNFKGNKRGKMFKSQNITKYATNQLCKKYYKRRIVDGVIQDTEQTSNGNEVKDIGLSPLFIEEGGGIQIWTIYIQSNEL